MQRLLRLLLVFFVLLIVIGCSDDDNPVVENFRGNPISGIKTGILSIEGSPYLVIDTLRVPDGQTLTIDAGVEVRFDLLNDNGRERAIPFIVEGTLIARGTEGSPIRFTSGLDYPSRGDWDGIWLMDADDGTVFEYCQFLFSAKYGRHYRYRTIGGQTDSTLYEYGSVSMFNSSPVLKKCLFLQGGFHGAHCDENSFPTIESCVFYDNAGHGIYIHESADPQMRYNIITENDDYGVYCRADGNSQNSRADLNLDYNIVWSNFSGEFNQACPDRLGRIILENENLDSCDYRYNLRLNPAFVDPVNLDFHLSPSSAAIDAGPEVDSPRDPDGTRIELGIYKYYYRPGEIRRRITVDRLEAAKSPYYMSCDALLPNGQTLTIEPGVEVRVEGRYMFEVIGNLLAEGTEAKPIKFRYIDETSQPGSWIGLIFDSAGDDNSELHHTQISQARWGISISQRDVLVDNCQITLCDSVGILCDDYAQPTIIDSKFSNNAVASILCQYNSSPLIQRCEIIGGSGYGIYARESSRPKVYNCVLSGISVDGIRLENLSSAEIVNNTFANNGYFGIYCSNNSSPDIRNNIFSGNGDDTRGGYGIFARMTSQPAIEYNCFYDHVGGSISISGTDILVAGTNIVDDPMFANASGHDYHLKAGSPCIHTGDPSILNTDNTQSDMGAYGGPESN